jgi:uncharacterized membrane protein
METSTPFDLNRAIQVWREDLALSPAIQREDLAELVSHLRDSIIQLEARGLSTEEAFLVATRRIGKRTHLEDEFGKVNSRSIWIERMLWMLIGVQVWGLVSQLVVFTSNGMLSLGLVGAEFNFAAHGQAVPGLLFTLVRVLAIAVSLAFCWWLFVCKGQRLGDSLNRLLHRPWTLALLCVLCGAMWVVVSAVGYGSNALLMKLAEGGAVSEVLASWGFASTVGWIIQAATLLVLTLMLAYRRSRTIHA